jgi:hypothetical protein
LLHIYNFVLSALTLIICTQYTFSIKRIEP